MKNRKKTRILALLLACCMVITLMPEVTLASVEQSTAVAGSEETAAGGGIGAVTGIVLAAAQDAAESAADLVQTAAGHIVAAASDILDEVLVTVESLGSGTVIYTGDDGVEYTFNESTGQITAVTLPEDATEFDLVIPSEINGVAVVSLKASLFSDNTVLKSVVIPDSVTTIESRAFYKCTSLVSVVLPSGLSSVGENVFRNCTSLTDVTIPEGVTVLGYGMFFNCTALTDITIPDSVTTIGDHAFRDCTSLANVTISDGVTTIGGYAFRDCTSLVNLTIPDSVTSIGQAAFYGCSSLAEITIPGSVTSIGSSAFTCTALTKITIPDSVTSIGSHTFSTCTSLTEVTIPDGVISIGDSAFYSCSALASISLPESLTELGGSAFAGCDSLTEITIPDGVTVLNGSTFSGCTSLVSVTLPSNLTTIGGGDFNLCTALEQIVIPDGVTSIGKNAFSGCTSLVSVTMPAELLTIGASAFYNCKALVSMELPSKLTTIGKSAFEYCTALTEITIPESVTTVSTYAFRYCSSLTAIHILGPVTTMGSHAFANCASVTEVTIADGVTEIGSCAFQSCTSLTDLEMPDSVTEIGTYAFRNCTSLTEVNLPANLVSIEGNAFRDCTSLTGIVIPNSVTTIDSYAFSDCTALESVTLPASLTEISENLFYGCTALADISIPDSVTSIGRSAFDGCTSLTGIVIPDSVTEIGTYAFQKCTSLTEAKLPAGLSTVGTNVFYGCSILAQVTIPDGVSVIGSYMFYRCYALDNVTIPASVTDIGSYAFYECTSLTSIALPESLTAVNERTFYGCTSLAEVTIPDSVTNIGNQAFTNCTSIYSITLPEELTSIGNSAFYGCSALTGIAIPSRVTTIGSSAFSNCTALADVTLPDGLLSIGADAFYYCTSLTGIVIPDGVTELNDSTFNGCSALVSVVLPANLTSIGSSTFSGCSSLAGINIPDSVASIGNYAFKECSSLVDIIIPDSVTSIGSYAFQKCTSLSYVAMSQNLESMGKYAFNNCTSLVSIEVPAGMSELSQYTFSGCSSLELIYIWNPDLTIGFRALNNVSSGLVVYGYPDSTAQTFAEENNYTFMDISVGYRTLSLTVCDEEGSSVTDGYSVYWYDSERNLLLRSSLTMTGTDPEQTYTAVITLEDDLLLTYVQPETITFLPEDDAAKTVTLANLGYVTLTGTVLDTGGSAVSGASITVTHNTLGKEYTAQTDETGAYQVEVPCADLTLKIQKDGYYSHSETLSLADVTDETCSVGTYALTATISDRIVLTIKQYNAVAEGEDATVSTLSSASSLGITLTDADGDVITGYDVQGTTLYFEEGVVSAGDIITVSITDLTGKYGDAEPVTVQLNDSRIGSATITMTQKGGFCFSDLGGSTAMMSVFNANGTNVLSGTVSAQKTYSGFEEGEYTIFLLEKTSLLLSVSAESYLMAMGLTEGTDYLKLTVTVADGVITTLTGYTVPELDENKVSYVVEDSTHTTISKPSGMTVGATFVYRSYFEVDESKGKTASTVQIVLPEGIAFSSSGVVVDGKVSVCSYDETTRTVTVNVQGKTSATIYLYCCAENEAGDYDITAYLNFTDGVLQPIGTSRATVEVSSLNTVERTGSDTIVVFGTTAPNSMVTLYDNDTQTIQTTSNSAGSWSVCMPLAGELYTYSYHYIRAEITSSLFEGTAVTEETLVTYDERSIDAKKITMYNYGHSKQATVFDLTSDSTIVPNYDYNPNYPTFTFAVDMSESALTYAEKVYVYTIDQYGDTTYVELSYDETSGQWVGSHDYTTKYIPVSVGVAYDVVDEYYAIPEDENWNEDMEAIVESCYQTYLDIWEDECADYVIYDYDEETGIGECIYTDPETSEETVLYTTNMVTSQLADGTTGSELSEEGFAVLDDEEIFWMRYGQTDDTVVLQYADLDAMELVIIEYEFLIMTEDSSTVESQSATYTSQATRLMSDSASTDDVVWYDSLDLRGVELFTNFVGVVINVYTPKLKVFIAGQNALSNSFTAIDTANDKSKIKNRVAANKQKMQEYYDKVKEMANLTCEDGSLKLGSHVLDELNLEIELDIQSDIDAYESHFEDSISALDLFAAENIASSLGKYGGYWWVSLIVSWTIGKFSSRVVTFGLAKADSECTEIMGKIATLQQYIISNYEDCGETDAPQLAEVELPSKKTSGNIDPSGYVYEAVPSNTLEGVTAVISYREITEDELTGNSVEQEVVWDAEDYDQVNPQVTDESGIFQWDVPTGEWKVTFTKDGYETTDTSVLEKANEDGWLEVPPPQLDLAVAMVSTEAPTVESVTAYTDRIEVVFSQYMDMESESTANVLNAITMTRDGKAVNVTVTALDAEYNLEGTTQYATRFMIVPTDGNLEGDLVVTIAAAAENYAGTAMGQKYTSETLTPVVRPTGIDAADTVEAVVHETTSIAVTLLPGVAGRTLTVTSSSDSIVSVSTASVTTDEDGNATVSVVANLPGEATVTVTEPISGVSTTITVNSVLTATEEVVVQPVKAYLADGTEVTTGMEIPSGSVITLVTETDGATIRYTVNDTCPCKDAALYYAEPITITEDTVLRAAACVDGVYSTTIRLELTVADSGSGDSGDSGSGSSGDSESSSGDSGSSSGDSSSGSSTTKKSQTLTAKAGSTTLVKGSTTTITASTTGNGKITYSSSNTSVAKVSSSGKITAVGKGTATITVTAAATSTYKKATKTIKITVKLLSTPKISSIKNTSSGVKLSWSKVTNAEKYAIYRKTSSGSWTKLGTTTSSSYTDTKASAGTLYQYRIICVTKSGSTTTSAYSATKKIVRMKTPSVKSITNTSSGVKLTWSKVTGATKYVIYRKEGSGSWKKLTTTTNLNYTDKKASAGKTYQYKIYSTVTKSSTTYKSAYSTAKKIVRMKTPSIKSITNRSSGVKLTWGKVTGATKYVIYRKEGSGSWKKLTTTTKLTYTDKKATAGKTYQYKIYASVTKSSTTYKSAYSSVKKMVRLKAVSISSVKNSASKKMTVKWSKNTKATGYQIQYSTSSSFASSKTKTVTISKAATVSRTIGSLTKGKTYYVRVRAYKKVSSTKYYSAWSSKKSVKISK